MSFETPAAFWALSSLALLVLFSLWRQAAARVTVPSIAIWKKIPERNPPVRALRRPRWRFELLLQALAIAAAVAALAGPYRETQELQPLRVALVFDTSARLRAENRVEKANQEAEGLHFQPNDEVLRYAATPAPRRLGKSERAAPIDEHVDLEPLLAAARAGSDHVVLFSDRPLPGASLGSFAAPADNAGIVELSATNDEVFVRIVNHGAPRPLPIELVAGTLTVRETIPAGEQRWSHRADYSKAESIRVSLDHEDSFPLDNVVEATRLTELRTTVSISGLIEPQMVKALRSIPGVTLTSGTGPAKVAIGVDAVPGPGEFRVWIFSPGTEPPGEPVIARHALTADLERRGSELALGELPPGERGGLPLITVGGKVAAALRDKELRLSIDVHRWGQGLHSLPIFFANVVDVARAGATGFAVLGTGRPFLLPPGWTLLESPQGVKPSLSPEGQIVPHLVGDYRFQTPSGPKRVRANLLDERESDTAGEARALDWNPARPAGRVPLRERFAGAAAGVSLALLVIAWIMQLRGE